MSTLFSIVLSINHEFLNFLDTFVQIITSTSWRKIIERNSIRFVQQKKPGLMDITLGPFSKMCIIESYTLLGEIM